MSAPSRSETSRIRELRELLWRHTSMPSLSSPKMTRYTRLVVASSIVAFASTLNLLWRSSSSSSSSNSAPTLLEFSARDLPSDWTEGSSTDDELLGSQNSDLGKAALASTSYVFLCLVPPALILCHHLLYLLNPYVDLDQEHRHLHQHQHRFREQQQFQTPVYSRVEQQQQQHDDSNSDLPPPYEQTFSSTPPVPTSSPLTCSSEANNPYITSTLSILFLVLLAVLTGALSLSCGTVSLLSIYDSREALGPAALRGSTLLERLGEKYHVDVGWAFDEAYLGSLTLVHATEAEEAAVEWIPLGLVPVDVEAQVRREVEVHDGVVDRAEEELRRFERAALVLWSAYVRAKRLRGESVHPTDNSTVSASPEVANSTAAQADNEGPIVQPHEPVLLAQAALSGAQCVLLVWIIVVSVRRRVERYSFEDEEAGFLDGELFLIEWEEEEEEEEEDK